MVWKGLSSFGFGKKRKVPDGLAMKCQKCQETVLKVQVDDNLHICPKCGFHFRITASERIKITFDEDSFTELYEDVCTKDVLEFVDTKPYRERLQENREKSGLQEAVVTGEACLKGRDVVTAVMDFNFIGASMGVVVGEKIARIFENAASTGRPAIVFATSGGARMQEGINSLMQMAKTSAAVQRLRQTRTPYISVLTNPTFAGVMASFASLGDLIIAEESALVGFTGPRVIEQTIKRELPEGFQEASFLLEYGQIDMIVNRNDMRDRLYLLIDYLT